MVRNSGRVISNPFVGGCLQSKIEEVVAQFGGESVESANFRIEAEIGEDGFGGRQAWKWVRNSALQKMNARDWRKGGGWGRDEGHSARTQNGTVRPERGSESTYPVAKLHLTATSSHDVTSTEIREDHDLVLAVFGTDKESKVDLLQFPDTNVGQCQCDKSRWNSDRVMGKSRLMERTFPMDLSRDGIEIP